MDTLTLTWTCNPAWNRGHVTASTIDLALAIPPNPWDKRKKPVWI